VDRLRVCAGGPAAEAQRLQKTAPGVWQQRPATAAKKSRCCPGLVSPPLGTGILRTLSSCPCCLPEARSPQIPLGVIPILKEMALLGTSVADSTLVHNSTGPKSSQALPARDALYRLVGPLSSASLPLGDVVSLAGTAGWTGRTWTSLFTVLCLDAASGSCRTLSFTWYSSHGSAVT
jgi:hypothetical protein